jgi:hypothetical protein
MRITSPESELAPYLEPNERLLWSGAPRGGIKFRSQDLFLIPFSLVWCGFAVFWTVAATSHGAPVFFTLWGLMFVCFGLFFVFGRFFTDLKKRQNTSYGVTSQRVLILSGLLNRELRSLNLRAIPEISLKQHSDGSGTISFGSSTYPGFGASRGWPGSEKALPPAFEFIDEPQAVHRLVLAQQKDA